MSEYIKRRFLLITHVIAILTLNMDKNWEQKNVSKRIDKE
jgi:hypothetical protein